MRGRKYGLGGLRLGSTIQRDAINPLAGSSNSVSKGARLAKVNDEKVNGEQAMIAQTEGRGGRDNNHA